MAFQKFMFSSITLYIILLSVQNVHSEINDTTPHVLTEAEIKEFTENYTLITADAKEEAANKTLCACGVSNPKRIAGGVATEINEFPWMVYLIIKKGAIFYFCGGFLINNRQVLTSALCTHNADLHGTTVYLGDHDRANPFDTPGIKVPVEHVEIHPQYNKPSYFNNDISIVTMKYSIRFTQTIRPICLLPLKFDFDFTRKSAIVAGWGASVTNGPLRNVLRKATVPFISNLECQRKYRETIADLTITPKMVCAGKEGKDICRGDEGGPLMIVSRDRYYAVGIVSFDLGCGSPYYPGVYTRLSKFIAFISKNTAHSVICH